MGSLAGLQRPLTAAAAVGLALVSTELPDKLPTSRTPELPLCSEQSSQHQFKSWVSLVSVSRLSNVSFPSRFQVPVPNVKQLGPSSDFYLSRNPMFSSLAMSAISNNPGFSALHRSAALVTPPNCIGSTDFKPSSPPEVLYRWHLPDPKAYNVSDDSECSSVKSKTVVVLLGWLGAKQKHMRRYAEWYTSRGYHVITFTYPMNEIVSYRVGGKTEEYIEMLVNHLADWLDEEQGKNLVFHTFSNTGWLTYGAILEKFQKQDLSLMGKIRGCVVDSAPVAASDPRVWASGFSAAFLKKQSIATKGQVTPDGSGCGILVDSEQARESIPAVKETVLLAILEKFFEVVLNLPKVNRRLSNVVDMLSLEQPKCPQLYIYSSADKVIPSEYVESFIEQQRKNGREVRACNFISSPHVDHFRNNPNLYTSQLTNFLDDCVLTRHKHAS